MKEKEFEIFKFKNLIPEVRKEESGMLVGGFIDIATVALDGGGVNEKCTNSGSNCSCTNSGTNCLCTNSGVNCKCTNSATNCDCLVIPIKPQL